jgi:hypothetical protein
MIPASVILTRTWGHKLEWPFPELQYVKITRDFFEQLQDRESFENDTQAAKYAYAFICEFFLGKHAKLPRGLESSFRRSEKRFVAKYRQSVINGAKNGKEHPPPPAQTPNSGTPDPQSDPQGSGMTPIVTKDIYRPQTTDFTPQTPYMAGFVYENPPSLDEVREYAESEDLIFIDEASLERWYRQHTREGWLNKKGEPLRAEVTDKETGEVLAGWQLFLRRLNEKAERDVERAWSDPDEPPPPETPKPQQEPDEVPDGIPEDAVVGVRCECFVGGCKEEVKTFEWHNAHYKHCPVHGNKMYVDANGRRISQSQDQYRLGY